MINIVLVSSADPCPSTIATCIQMLNNNNNPNPLLSQAWWKELHQKYLCCPKSKQGQSVNWWTSVMHRSWGTSTLEEKLFFKSLSVSLGHFHLRAPVFGLNCALLTSPWQVLPATFSVKQQFFFPFPVSHGWFMHRCYCWGKWLKEREHLCDPLQFNNSLCLVSFHFSVELKRNPEDKRKQSGWCQHSLCELHLPLSGFSGRCTKDDG